MAGAEALTERETRGVLSFIALAFARKWRVVSGMRLRSIPQLLLFSALTLSLQAAVSLPSVIGSK